MEKPRQKSVCAQTLRVFTALKNNKWIQKKEKNTRSSQKSLCDKAYEYLLPWKKKINIICHQKEKKHNEWTKAKSN